jgi:hypothetical protein
MCRNTETAMYCIHWNVSFYVSVELSVLVAFAKLRKANISFLMPAKMRKGNISFLIPAKLRKANISFLMPAKLRKENISFLIPAKLRKGNISFLMPVCLSVPQYGTTLLPLGGFA